MNANFFGKQYKVVPLDDLGIRDYGLYYDDAISLIRTVAKNKKRILGGDIILRMNGRWFMSNDSWYSTKGTPEGTLQDALCFLEKYKKQTDGEWVVCVVIEN